MLGPNAHPRKVHLLVFLICTGCTSQGTGREPTVANAQSCDEWNTYVFFAQANLADVERCLAAGADPNARDEHGFTPLHWTRDAAAARILLEAGANVHSRNRRGDTPLHSTSAAVTRVLLAAGADPDARNDADRTPLHVVPRSAQRVQLLLDAGADVNARGDVGHTPLHTAASHNLPAAVAVLC